MRRRLAFACLLALAPVTLLADGIYGVPETFVVDRHGRIVGRHAGVLSADVVARWIEPALRR
jgi:hypothetical protein